MSETGPIIPTRPNPQEDPLGAGIYDATRIPIFVIDPKKFDHKKINELQEKIKSSTGDDEQKARKELYDHMGEEIRIQLELGHAGITSKIDQSKLGEYGLEILSRKGPLTGSLSSSMGELYFISSSKWNKDELKNIPSELSYKNPENLKPLPRNPEDYIEFLIKHEAAHIRTDSHIGDYGVNPESATNEEIYADNQALDHLRKTGRADVANAIIDLRVIGSMNSMMTVPPNQMPTSHATGFFLNENGVSKQPTESDMKALMEMKSTMLSVVQSKLGNDELALDVFLKDPAKFHNYLKEANKEGLLGRRAMTSEEVREHIAKDMGVKPDELTEKMQDPKFFNDYSNRKDQLESEGKLTVADANIQQFAQKYLDAYNRRVEETPAPKPAANATLNASHQTSDKNDFIDGIGRYDYLLAELPHLVKNKPSNGISINPETWQANIGGLSCLKEAFAIEADPFLSCHKQLMVEEYQQAQALALNTQFLDATKPPSITAKA